MSLTFTVEQDGHHYDIGFDDIDTALTYGGDTIIGIDSVKLAEAIELARDGVWGEK